MKQGALFFDETADRYDIRFDLADYYGGLHCAACHVVAASAWRYSQAASGSRPAWSTATTGILRVSAPRT